MKQVWGVTMVRNEADIIGYTLDHMVSEGLSGLVVANNLSTDKTLEEIESFKRRSPIPVVIVEDNDPRHDQSRKMTALASIAGANRADWIVPFDADELWVGRTAPLAKILSKQQQTKIICVSGWTHVETGHDDDSANPFKRMSWRRPEILSFPKVCYRYDPSLTIWHGNDSIVGKNGQYLTMVADTDLQIRHFPARGADHFISKMVHGAQALKATDLPRSVGSQWRACGRIFEKYGESALQAIYFSQMFFIEPRIHGLIQDPAPWRRWA